MKPELNKEITLKEFQDYYWLGKELKDFCRKNNLPTVGSKIEVTERITEFLETGKILKPKTRDKKPKFDDSNLSLDFIIPVGHRCTQKVREFFKKEIPNFHFSTEIQNYLKENAGKKYSDVIEEWYRLKELKSSKGYNKNIAPQFEFNTFIRDYFKDSSNKGKKRSDAIELWNTVKSQPGSNKYEDFVKSKAD